jgi:phenylacetate-CoA ligase
VQKWLEKIYNVSPVWIQKLGVNAFGWYWSHRRLGPAFERYTREYQEREAWSADRMRDFVETQLRAQVQRAYRNVPYYRQAFRDAGVSEATLEKFTLDDLDKLPLLQKQFVRAQPGALLTEQAAQSPPAAFQTSGSTGTPIQVFWDTQTHQHNIGVREARSFRWAGTSIRDPRSVIGGRLVVPRAHARPPFCRYNHWEKQLYLSAYHLSPQNLPDYVAALNRYRPATMLGYASSNFLLARLIEESGMTVHAPRAVIAESERTLPHMRETLARVFRTRVFAEYGSVENCALATECERGRMHAHPDFGWIEILRPDGTPVPPGEVGELVLTGFANTNQIFIRYRIGDLGAWSAESCPCGRNALPVLSEIVGRMEDVVYTRDGRELWAFFRVFYGLKGISEGQIIQEDLERFTVNVVANAGWSEEECNAIRARIRQRVGPEVEVNIRRMDFIPREANGKFRVVISRVQRPPSAGFSGPSSAPSKKDS